MQADETDAIVDRLDGINTQIRELKTVVRRLADKLKVREKTHPAPVNLNKEYLTPSEVARLLNIARSTVQDGLRAGTIKHICLPSFYPNATKFIRRIPREEVARILKGQPKKRQPPRKR